MADNVGARLSTDTAYIKDLTRDIRKGEIKIPKFQRPFVWKSEQALDLLDSISRSYPAGSLLLWRTHDKLVAERNIGDFRLPETDDLSPTDYVLDGQQRLTVIFASFGAAPQEEGFAAAYDLQDECFVELPQDAPLHIFPLRYTFDTPRLLDYRSALNAHAEKTELQARLDGLIDAITGYKLPVVTLKELTVDEVCPIFERINSSGTRLSTYDLMVAATWSEEFDLNDEATAIAESLAPKGFEDIEGDTILKCMSGVHNESIKKKDVLDLRRLARTDLDSLSARTREALLKSVDALTTEFGIYSWDFLPYEALIVITSAVFSGEGTLSAEAVTRLRQWFWRSAFSQHYRGASESFVSKDIASVRGFVAGADGDASDFGEMPSADVIARTAFRSNNSRSRAVVLALASQNPRNLTNGAAIDVAEALSSFNKKQFHHVYPKAHLRRVNSPGEHNSLANICMLAASENQKISDTDPTAYLPQCIGTLGPDASAVFVSNLLPRPDEFEYGSATYQDFLAVRAAKIHELAVRLCNGEAV